MLKSITEDFMVPVLYACPYLELFGDVAVASCSFGKP